jgi:hypothetical protein
MELGEESGEIGRTNPAGAYDRFRPGLTGCGKKVKDSLGREKNIPRRLKPTSI